MELHCTVTPGLQPGVVPGDDTIETEFLSPVDHSGELHSLVTPQARVGGTAPGVLINEIVHHLAAEKVSEIPHLKVDAETLSDLPGIMDVVVG
jgi:hypothetical protein